jgi:hypothetical protein
VGPGVTAKVVDENRRIYDDGHGASRRFMPRLRVST